MKFKVDENRIWEDTGKVVIYNYPAPLRQRSYLCRVYREFVRGKLGSKEVEGEFVYFESLSPELLALAKNLGEAQNALSAAMPREEYLQKI